MSEDNTLTPYLIPNSLLKPDLIQHNSGHGTLVVEDEDNAKYSAQELAILEENQLSGLKHLIDENKDQSPGVLLKFNKHNKGLESLDEVRITHIARALLNTDDRETVSEVQLAVRHEADNTTVAGVAVKLLPNFVDFTQYNLIDVIAQCELEEREENSTLEKKLQDISSALSNEEAKKQRHRLFKEYMGDLYLRRLLHEDDMHAGNVGSCIPNSDEVDLKQIQIHQIDFDMAAQPVHAAKNSSNTRQSQLSIGTEKLAYTDETLAEFYKCSHAGFWISTTNLVQTKSFAITESLAFTNNKGRYLTHEARRFKQLCALPEYNALINEVIAEKTSEFLALSPTKLFTELETISSESLTKNGLTLTDAESLRTDLTLCQFIADQQAKLVKIIENKNSKIAQSIIAGKTTPKTDYNRILSQYHQRLADEKEIERQYLDAIYSFGSKIKMLPEKEDQKIFSISARQVKSEKTSAERLVVDPNTLELRLPAFVERYSYNFSSGSVDVKKQEFRQEFKAKFVNECNNYLDMEQLVSYWEHVQQSQTLITQVSVASLPGKLTKQHVFNCYTSTYVTMRDLLLTRALELQQKGTEDQKNDYATLIARLKSFGGLRLAHSYHPINFTTRLTLDARKILLDNYKPLTFSNYRARHTPNKYKWLCYPLMALYLLPNLAILTLAFAETLTRSIKRGTRKLNAHLQTWLAQTTQGLLYIPSEVLKQADFMFGLIFQFLTNWDFAKDYGLGPSQQQLIHVLQPLAGIINLLEDIAHSENAVIRFHGLVPYWLIMGPLIAVRLAVRIALYETLPFITKMLPHLITYTAIALPTLVQYLFKAMRHVLQQVITPITSYRHHKNWINNHHAQNSAAQFFALHLVNHCVTALILSGMAVGIIFAAPYLAAALGASSALVATFAIPATALIKLAATLQLTSMTTTPAAITLLTGLFGVVTGILTGTANRVLAPPPEKPKRSSSSSLLNQTFKLVNHGRTLKHDEVEILLLQESPQ